MNNRTFFHKAFRGITTMPVQNKIEQLKHESDTWKRCLQFIQEENNNLKRRLSEVLQTDADKDFLERAEYFQNEFLSEDNIVTVLRYSIKELDDLTIRETFEDGAVIKELVHKQKKLNRDIEKTENHFSRLKSEFNNFLSDVL